MVKVEIKPSVKTMVFTRKKHRVIIAQAGSSRRFFLIQRCILPTLNDAGILYYLLEDYFPTQIFNKNENIDNLDILNYVHQVNGQWLLDLVAMSRSKYFAHLFHEDFPSVWNKHTEDIARKKYGRADITRFFIDMENDKFFREFSRLKKANMANVDKDTVSNMFLDKLGYYNGKSVWEDWDYTNLVMHKSANVYKAFKRYAHKIYTLLGFGLFKLNAKNAHTYADSTVTKLLLEGQKLLDMIVKAKLPIITKITNERQIKFFELEQDVLESVPTGGSIYAPTEVKIFINQLKSRIPNFLKQRTFDNPDNVNQTELFNPSDRKSINKYMEKLGQYIKEMEKTGLHIEEAEEDFSDYRKVKLDGTYREKVTFLHRIIGKPLIRTFFKRELENIYGLINKLFLPDSLDTPHVNAKNGESFLPYEITGDEKNVSPDDHLSWADLFTNVFRQELDEQQLKNFLDCIPKHIKQYPPEYDSAKNFKMTYHSKKMLFSTFCSVAGIEGQELWEPFLELINQVIENINIVRNDIRSRS